MLSLLARVVLLLWPFFKEVFLKNDDVRYAIRRNWVAIVLFAILTTLVIVFLHTTDLFYRAHDRYQIVTEEYITLEHTHQEMLEVRDKLRAELEEVYGQFDELENRIREVAQENRRLKERKDSLLLQIENLQQQEGLAEQCFPRESLINQRLENIRN